MASIFDLLRGQQGSPDDFLMSRFQEEDDDELYDPAAPIDVFGTSAQPQAQQAAAQGAPQAGPSQRAPLKSFEEEFGAEYGAPERKGRFGQKGVLRDILGTLGDAFLVQGGADAMYAPRREREKEADAMVGFSRNPLKAIERLAQENPKAAREMYEKYQTNALGMDKLEFDQDKWHGEAPDREALRAGRQATQQRTLIGNARSALGSVSNQADYDKLKPQLAAKLSQVGLGEMAELLPDQYDPQVNMLFIDPEKLAMMEDRDALRAQQAYIAKLRVEAQKRGQNLNYELGKGRLGVAQQNADTAEKRVEKQGSTKRSFNFGPPPSGIPAPPTRGGVRPR